MRSSFWPRAARRRAAISASTGRRYACACAAFAPTADEPFEPDELYAAITAARGSAIRSSACGRCVDRRGARQRRPRCHRGHRHSDGQPYGGDGAEHPAPRFVRLRHRLACADARLGRLIHCERPLRLAREELANERVVRVQHVLRRPGLDDSTPPQHVDLIGNPASAHDVRWASCYARR
jgi:hypothetical protein